MRAAHGRAERAVRAMRARAERKGGFPAEEAREIHGACDDYLRALRRHVEVQEKVIARFKGGDRVSGSRLEEEGLRIEAFERMYEFLAGLSRFFLDWENERLEAENEALRKLIAENEALRKAIADSNS
jgi:hypothetical protein